MPLTAGGSHRLASGNITTGIALLPKQDIRSAIPLSRESALSVLGRPR